MPSLDSSPDRFIIPTFSNRATCFLIHIERAVNQRKSRSRTWPCAHDGAGSKRKKTERRTGLSAVAARADRQHACSESVNVNYRGIGSRKGMIHGKRGFEDRGNRANELRLLVNFFHVWIVCPAIWGLFDFRPTKRFYIRSSANERFDLCFHVSSRFCLIILLSVMECWNDCKIFETKISLIIQISFSDEVQYNLSFYPSKSRNFLIIKGLLFSNEINRSLLYIFWNRETFSLSSSSIV